MKKVVLAYSGGLDTSVILKWIKETYGCEVIAYVADLGQKEDLEEVRVRARETGASQVVVEDVREEFVTEYVFPALRANAVYEGTYLMGTSLARPLIARRQLAVAHREGAEAVAHGATGKGNDQVRFELTYLALDPHIKVVAPWREWDFRSRKDLIDYAREKDIKVTVTAEKPYSVDANLLHTSYEGGVLEDPWTEPSDDMFLTTLSPEQAPDRPLVIEVDFEKGNPVAVDGTSMSPATLLEHLNRIGGDNGIGRVDMVENRFVGMKSRGVYETPGGTIYAVAHRGIEQITLDRGAAHLKDELMPRYAELIYNGFWFAPEREMLQAAIDHSQEKVNGTVRLKLYKGAAHLVGRKSPDSLYSEQHVTFEDDAGAYDQKDAQGFIKLNALRLRLLAQRDR
ncbi:MAG: argininosuccinate synthase [Thermodesulfobacteriota bacterium]